MKIIGKYLIRDSQVGDKTPIAMVYDTNVTLFHGGHINQQTNVGGPTLQ